MAKPEIKLCINYINNYGWFDDQSVRWIAIQNRGIDCNQYTLMNGGRIDYKDNDLYERKRTCQTAFGHWVGKYASPLPRIVKSRLSWIQMSVKFVKVDYFGFSVVCFSQLSTDF